MSIRTAAAELVEAALDEASQLITHSIGRTDTLLQLGLEVVVEAKLRRSTRLHAADQAREFVITKLLVLIQTWLATPSPSPPLPTAVLPDEPPESAN